MRNEWCDLRPIRPDDLEAILKIEREAMPAPWSAGQVRAELGAANGLGLAAGESGGLCGYAFFRMCHPECELLHLVVSPACRRRGIAASLLLQALGQLSGEGFTSCLLEVRDSNTAARHLYAQMGFVQVGRRKGYYRQPLEDALLLIRNLNALQ